jgi:hypothetical protein
MLKSVLCGIYMGHNASRLQQGKVLLLKWVFLISIARWPGLGSANILSESYQDLFHFEPCLVSGFGVRSV